MGFVLLSPKLDWVMVEKLGAPVVPFYPFSFGFPY